MVRIHPEDVFSAVAAFAKHRHLLDKVCTALEEEDLTEADQNYYIGILSECQDSYVWLISPDWKRKLNKIYVSMVVRSGYNWAFYEFLLMK
ncbi:hypothetical protein QR680_004928 [Steinernema hermaphroditum]|uniref:Uncharacterized protein n=1 Tax=Steinernema hermaphroditum TaxID=289476 RepID=A0AA39LUT4_9BILA|nr:hypothetical protein QR680_004928 [Steinernema hermaphroditum]